jgi:hypothetical protein
MISRSSMARSRVMAINRACSAKRRLISSKRACRITLHMRNDLSVGIERFINVPIFWGPEVSSITKKRAEALLKRTRTTDTGA